MAYPGQTWVDGVTPLDAVHMNALDQGVVNAVDVDNVATAASQIVANKLLAADSQPAFRINGNGQIRWGPGGSTALDVTLARSTGQTGLVLTGSMNISDRLFIDPSSFMDPLYAGIVFGSGTANLYQSASGVLKMENSLVVAGNISSLLAKTDTQPQIVLSRNYAGAGLPGIAMGPGGSTVPDTNLYRAAASNLKTDGNFSAGTEITARLGLAEQVKIGAIGTGKPIIVFGTAGDGANIYRPAADTLQTDGKFVSAWQAYDGKANFQAVTYLYNMLFSGRVGGDTNDRFVIGSSGEHNWGAGNAATDTNLYRFGGAGGLKTDAAFTVGADPGFAGYSALWINISGIGTKQVLVGAPDSGGAGFRMLRVSN